VPFGDGEREPALHRSMLEKPVGSWTRPSRPADIVHGREARRPCAICLAADRLTVPRGTRRAARLARPTACSVGSATCAKPSFPVPRSPNRECRAELAAAEFPSSSARPPRFGRTPQAGRRHARAVVEANSSSTPWAATAAPRSLVVDVRGRAPRRVEPSLGQRSDRELSCRGSRGHGA
jgi:hypothetical protein